LTKTFEGQTMLKYITILILLLASFQANARLQGQKLIDSLEAELLKAKSDSAYINILSTISIEYSYLKKDKSFDYAAKAEKLAIEKNLRAEEARSYIAFSNHYWYKNNFDSSIYYFKKSAIIFEELGLIDKIARNYYWQGVAYSNLSKNDSAVTYLKKALDLFGKIKDTFQIANCYGDLGIVYKDKSDFKNAVKSIEDAIKYAEAINDYITVQNCYITLSNINRQTLEFEKALSLLNYALEIEKDNDIEYSGKGTIYGNMGAVYYHLEDYENAIKYSNLAIDIHLKDSDSIEIAKRLTTIALSYEKQNKFDEAIEIYKRSLNINSNTNFNKKGVAIDKANIGVLYKRLYNDSTLKNNSLKQKYLELAIENLSESNKLFKEIKHLNHTLYTAGELSDLFKYDNNFQMAYKYLSEHITLKDSIFDIDKAREIASLTAEREQIESEKEIEILKQREIAQENEKQLISYSAIGGVSLVGIFALLIYIRLRKEKKLAIALEEQKHIVEGSKEELEIQQRQLEVTHYELVEKNEKVIESIRYAETIQNAMLPWESTLNAHLNEYFLIFKPKDIVSGDFYWFKKIENGYLIAVADCTGHGVPGSMISMMGSSILDEAVLSLGPRNTGEILAYLNNKMIEALNKQVSENESRDGMDICLVRVILQEQSVKQGDRYSEGEHLSLKKSIALQFSGAKRPLYLYQDGGLQTIKGDRSSIAGEKNNDLDFKFTTHEIQASEGDKLFLTSDGFTDQIGTNGKKFGTKKFKELIAENRYLAKTYGLLSMEFDSFIGDEPQRDDITVLGIEL
jgi:serine phosphatase RsbU (regulator of sigma subunit)/Tfp pilus assembly protein PilF